MAQLFSPAANTIARVSILAGAALPLVLAFTLSRITRSPANTKVEVPINQPIPFSHQHHNKELGIDCRFCHTQVTEGSFAGVPSTDTCMTCHSQVWTNSPLLEPVRDSQTKDEPIVWNRVNAVPEFVYFDHSIHVAKGVSCNTCHGAVQDMHLTYKGSTFAMSWCLSCHRDPGKFLYEDLDAKDQPANQQVFNLYWKIQAGKKLTPRERALADGKEYKPNAAEIERGRELVKERGIDVKQLEDCSICHR